MPNPWFRLYAEFAGDPVIQSMAFEDQRHFVVLMCLKCDGVLDRPIAAKARDKIICRGLGLDPVAASEAKRRLVEVNLIDNNWQPSGWNKRQFVSDVSTGRVRKSRSKSLKDKEAGNVPETLPKRFGNAPDTDTDTDTDKHPPTPSKGDAHSTFDAFWKAYPKKVERKGALAIWTRRKLDKLSDKIIADVERRTTDDELWRQGYIPHPTTYLNGDRWEDQYGKAGEAQAKPDWMTGGWE